MIVRIFWRNCDFRGGHRGADPIDAFWLESTATEAEAAVFPRLSEKAAGESREVAEKFKSLAEHLSNPVRPFCFLVTRDLSAIEPMHVHFPFHQIWNAASPFEQMPPKEIKSLDELREMKLPEAPPNPETRAESAEDEIDEDEL